YRGRKFVGRHRTATAAGAIIVLLIAGFTIQAQILARRAERERVKAQTVSKFLIDLFRIASPNEGRGAKVTAREMLDRGAGKIEAEMGAQPDVRADLLSAMGTAYSGLGLFNEAAPVYQKALDASRRAFGDGSPETARAMVDYAAALLY